MNFGLVMPYDAGNLLSIGNGSVPSGNKPLPETNVDWS